MMSPTQQPRQMPLCIAIDWKEIVMEGWLHERSWPTFEKRWCVLSPRYLCVFEAHNLDYTEPIVWVHVGECQPKADDANNTFFHVKSVDNTLLLAAASLEERESWIASISKQFTHDWEPIVAGARFPEGAVCSKKNGRGDCDIVARNPQGECGKMSFLSGRCGGIKCHHFGQTDFGAVLVPRAGTTLKWLPIKRGDPLPDFAVYVGYSSQDRSKIYVGRSRSGQFGKINLERGAFWNLWVPSDHRPEGRHESGEILVILPPGACSTSGAPGLSSDDPERRLAASLAENRESVTKTWDPSQIIEVRIQGTAAFLGGCCATPPREALVDQGSFGCVRIGEDLSTGQFYAVKSMLTKSKSLHDSVAKLANQIKSNPHLGIVRLFLMEHFAFDNGDIYMFLMEFCHGEYLQLRIEAAIVDEKYTVPAQALTWIGQVFLALEHLHLCVDAIVCDLKPGKIVISKSGSAKLTDFGYRRIFAKSDGSWNSSMSPDSVGYIAPEVLCQEQYDQRADLYSFGMLTWVLLSGGVRSSTSPRPPSLYTSGFSDCKKDWERGRCNISKEASEMISALTRRDPLERINHREIRQKNFMKVARVPDLHAEPGAMEDCFQRRKRWWERLCMFVRPRSRPVLVQPTHLPNSSLPPSVFIHLTPLGSTSSKADSMQELEDRGFSHIEIKGLLTDDAAVEDVSDAEANQVMREGSPADTFRVPREYQQVAKTLRQQQKDAGEMERPENLRKWKTLVERPMVIPLPYCEIDNFYVNPPTSDESYTGLFLTYVNTQGQEIVEVWMMTKSEMDKRDKKGRLPKEEAPAHWRLAELAMAYHLEHGRAIQGSKLGSCIGFATSSINIEGKRRLKANSCVNIISDPMHADLEHGAARCLTSNLALELMELLNDYWRTIGIKMEVSLAYEHNGDKDGIWQILQDVGPERAQLQNFKYDQRQGEPLGSGVFGTVYAVDEKTVVKVVPLSNFDTSRHQVSQRNIERELLFLRSCMHRKLMHPGIVQPLGATRGSNHDGVECVFFFLERLQTSLQQKLYHRENKDGLNSVYVRRYTRHVTRALGYLHKLQIAHRDVKPANILISAASRVAKLADYGSSTRENAAGSCTGALSVVGTAIYMAPELMNGRRAGTKVDIWSLGCTVGVALTGDTPWGGAVWNDMIRKVNITDDPPIMVNKGPHMMQFLTRCWERDPRNRASCEDLLSETWMRYVRAKQNLGGENRPTIDI